MSTHSRSESSPASPEQTQRERIDASRATRDDPADATPAFDAHDAAATFDSGCTHRLPNTVDRENEHVG